MCRTKINYCRNLIEVGLIFSAFKNYYTKAALIILQSRIALPPAYAKGSDTRRINKWVRYLPSIPRLQGINLLMSASLQFNIELDETDALREDFRLWKSCGVIENRPSPMVVEIFIDTQDLTNNQSLAIIDDDGKRWDVEEALRNFVLPDKHGDLQRPRSEVILERWHIELGKMTRELPKDLGSILPRVYKHSIVLFRSLYTYAKLLPTWKIGKRLKSRSSNGLPRLKYRVMEYDSPRSPYEIDELTLPLLDGQDHVTEHYDFEPIESPAGQFSIKVSYRANCHFRIDNSEALLSSHFMGMDEEMFVPSLGHRQRRGEQKMDRKSQQPEMGSMPHALRDATQIADQGQAYGSLSTFHNTGPRIGSSPLSALRAARDMNMESPTDSPPLKAPPNHRSAQGSRSSLRSTDVTPVMGRRTSVSFMPFKTPSLSASPRQTEQANVPSTTRGSIGKNSPLSALAEARTPTSSHPNASQSTKGSPVLLEQVPASSAASSPRPATTARYSSSFGHRRARLSVGGGSRTDDDNNSSGKTSLTSSAVRPGSEVLAEGGASSGSVHTDDDNISEFLKMLDQKKDLKSFQTPTGGSAIDASTRRTTAALSKFHRMRESHAALSDSISSSQVLQRSSSSSSRQLSSVPPMVAGTSMSISSSPGKPISPHTPHTPAIPSRLSANSIAEYNQRERSVGRRRHSLEEETEIIHNEDSVSHNQGTEAIDIPTSPRPFHPNYRRSSSVAQQHRPLPVNDDIGDILPFGLRSTSLGGGDERPPLNLSELLRLGDGSEGVVPVSQGPPFGPPQASREEAAPPLVSLGSRDEDRPNSARGTSFRPRIGRGSGRGQTPPQGSITSLAGDRGSGSGSSDQRGGRYSFTRPANTFEEEEPLLFAMSDFGAVQSSRRSLEEGRGGSSAGASERGGGDSGGSSRRGSRRGGTMWN